ncbi:uncharacterized protein BP01DRAFT_143394 [Aspergillus saccharolyticus JOP 1030-1]|uniref:Uncharacterized protein n=1 Tax=Aspergillus saccharolyticus JOP 1030-1 TaxID=1450539 RepID=A0A318Z6F5_9EURO|nr:hypothetical protein BP01DRAFT_143394 [Aspergillus saccharolyticus JOP 1030-1]PYH42024.1 hypothetical protein BP01DRAFT_143394 [Aspergillus saccharolyticus JOP 1030-1]
MNVPIGLSQTFNVNSAKNSKQGMSMPLPCVTLWPPLTQEGHSLSQQVSESARTAAAHAHPEQEEWSWDNLPDILYQLNPNGPKSKDPIGLKTYTINGKYLRDIPVLPDSIPADVEEFRVEAWIRLDRRIRLEDIIDRMPEGHRVRPNALQQRGGRFRQAFSLCAWDSGNKKSIRLVETLKQKLVAAGIDPALNTTRGLTPGLINPVLGEIGGRIDLPKPYRNKRIVKENLQVATNKRETRGTRETRGVDSSASPAITIKQVSKSVVSEHSSFSEYILAMRRSLLWKQRPHEPHVSSELTLLVLISAPLWHPYETILNGTEDLHEIATENCSDALKMFLSEEEQIALCASWTPHPEGADSAADAQDSGIYSLEDWSWYFQTFDFQSASQQTDSLYDTIMQDYHDRELWCRNTPYSGMFDPDFDL